MPRDDSSELDHGNNTLEGGEMSLTHWLVRKGDQSIGGAYAFKETALEIAKTYKATVYSCNCLAPWTH